MSTTTLALVSDVPENAVHVYLISLGAGSRRTMRHSLQQIARFVFGWMGDDVADFPWHELRVTHTLAVRSFLAERYAPNTANKGLAAMRGVLKAAHRLDQIPDVEYRRAVGFKPVRGERRRVGRALTALERLALFRITDRTSELDARDWAIVAVLYGAGIRRHEARALDLAHVELGAEPPSLLVQGKGNKERRVFFCAGTGSALAQYIEIRGSHAGALFHPCRGHGRRLQRDSRMGIETITSAMHRLAARAGIEDFTPHDLRRTFISDLIDAQADLVAIQRLAGHSQIQTTASYDRRGERAAARAAGLLSVPVEPCDNALSQPISETG